MGAFAGAWQRLFEIRQTATAQDAADLAHEFRTCRAVRICQRHRDKRSLCATFSEGVEFFRLNIGYGFS